MQTQYLFATIKRDFDLFFGLINEGDGFGDISSDSLNSEVHNLVFGLLQLQFERDSLTLDLQVDLMQTVYVKSDGLLVLNIVPRSKHYGHLDYILGLPFVVRIDRQEHLSRVQFEVQKEVLLKLGFDGHGRVVPVKHLQIHDLRKRLFQHETGTEIVVIKRQFH